MSKRLVPAFVFFVAWLGSGRPPAALAGPAGTLQPGPAPQRPGGEPRIAATLAIVGGRLIDGYGGAPLDNAIVLVDGDPLQQIELLQHAIVHVIKDGVQYK